MPKSISCAELSARLAAGEPTHLIDVRQPWEHQTAALANSILIPLDQLPAVAGQLQAAPGALIVTVCHHGVRSLSAAAVLEAAGFPSVASLAGGIDAWSLQIDPKVPRY